MDNDKWIKSSYSGPHDDVNCVEVMRTADGVTYVRDSKDPAVPPLEFNRGEWDAFLRGAADGQFNL